MKVCMITDVYYPYVKGGAEKRISKVAERLSEKGHDVHVYCMKFWDGSAEHKVNDNLTLHGVCKPFELYTESGVRSVKEALHFSYKLLGPLFKKDFDVVDVSEFPFFPIFSAKLYCVLKRKPLVATWHEVWGRKYWNSYLGGFKGFFGYLVEKASSYLPDEFIVNSEHTCERLGKGVVIHNGIDTEDIAKAKKSSVKYDVLYAGRLVSHKNVDVLLNAVSIVTGKIPSVKVGIIGIGPEADNLKKLASSLGVSKNVTFINHVDDLYSYMKSAKVFVLPSSREGFGMVVAESHGCSTPVITVRHQHNASSKLVANKENGYVVKLSAGAIAERIVHMCENEDVTVRMSKSAMESSKKYCWDEVAKRTERVYNGVV